MYSSLQSSSKLECTHSNYILFPQRGVGLPQTGGRTVFPVKLSWAWVLDVLRYLVGLLPPQDIIIYPCERQCFSENTDPHCQRTHSYVGGRDGGEEMESTLILLHSLGIPGVSDDLRRALGVLLHNHRRIPKTSLF